MTDCWTPILEGQAHGEALAVVQEIASELRLYVGSGSLTLSRLADGLAGIALFFHHAGIVLASDELEELAFETISEAIERSAEITTIRLFDGITGVAWAAEILAGVPVADHDELDRVLSEELDRRPWPHSLDLVGGLVGVGVYALRRRGQPTASTALRLVVEHLQSLASARWMSAPESLSSRQRELFPDGCTDLGVAHGVPGIVSWLASVHACGLAPEGTAELVVESASWVLSKKRPEQRFPRAISSDRDEPALRSAWCYGDLGVLASLHSALRGMGDCDARWMVRQLLQRAARDDASSDGVVDGCLCHGSAGNAHLFNTLYQATRDRVFLEAARARVRQTLRSAHVRARHRSGIFILGSR